MVGFVGPNGAGKTTAMRITLGVLGADAGEVRWRGRPVDGVARRRFGYIPEERGLYPKMRVLDQLVYLARLHGVSRAAAGIRGLEILETLGVADRAKDRVESLVAREPAAGAARRRPRVRARPPRARRAVLGPRPGRHRRLDRGAGSRTGVAGRADRVLQPPVGARGARVRPRRDDRRRADRRRWRDRRAARVARATAGARGGLGGPGRLARVDPRRAARRGGPRRVIVELEDDADDQRVLDLARSVGEVRHFSRVRPTLSELFREVTAT